MTRSTWGSLSGEHGFAINLMQHLAIPTVVIDTSFNVMIWNYACEQLTGVQASEVLGTRDYWRAFYDTPSPCLIDVLARKWLNSSAKISQEKAPPTPTPTPQGLKVEYWCTMPRLGKDLYLAVDAGPVYDNEGHLLGVVETIRDMTEHKRSQLVLQQLATHDSLTGLSNRRMFDEHLQVEWQRALRQKTPLSLVMIDIDFFKFYNDCYGHLGGDLCLKSVASAIKENLGRPSDLTARYGGEEFAIVLPGTDYEGAKTVAERILKAVSDLGISHERSECSNTVTISVGVAGFIPSMDMFPEDLIAAADKALYQAKHLGRNRVVGVQDLISKA